MVVLLGCIIHRDSHSKLNHPNEVLSGETENQENRRLSNERGIPFCSEIPGRMDQ
ncbi:hypothetical protein LEP1GSC195_1552 [Leptospira wolbachii serovar Codice str. CDC]|uniref:Uncharacterized protein n=1 Tax=Leptospira wolbachii serovar Codice str. CDC TaxID=1218599 RepID=R8ZZF6_9LEPT|nr:hypothetical protein LEP1GSC195_1552 [Leptospira wolbachii serovar Codice str. CDC]